MGESFRRFLARARTAAAAESAGLVLIVLLALTCRLVYLQQFRDTVIPNVALNAVAGRPKEEYGLEPQGLDEIRKGFYNVDERIKDMNADGILGSICFPSCPGFAGRLAPQPSVTELHRPHSSALRVCGVGAPRTRRCGRSSEHPR